MQEKITLAQEHLFKYLFSSFCRDMSGGGCCPAGSWGKLEKDSDYKDKGIIDVIDDLPIYRVGSSNSNKCIVWNYDVGGFGGNSGSRTRQLCDQLADKGYMVLLPDYYRGKLLEPKDFHTPKCLKFIQDETNWDILKDTWLNIIKPYAQQHGAKVFGTIGTCWGSYPVIRFSSLSSEFAAGVSMHPTHPQIMTMLKEEEAMALEEAKSVPQLFLPAGNDEPSVKAGGIAEKILGKSLEIIEFADMLHGWTTRGDISDPKVEAEVKRAMMEATKFFDKHLK